MKACTVKRESNDTKIGCHENKNIYVHDGNDDQA